MDITEQYPEVEKYLDNTDEYTNTASEFLVNDDRYLIVTQEGETDGGQILFRATVDGWAIVDSDTNIDIAQNSFLRSAMGSTVAVCGASSDAEHETVRGTMVDQVDRFSTANGPGGGNLACVWAVRRLVHMAIGRWITRTDATAVFDAELQRCYGSTWQETDVGAGAIIISPTETRSDGTRNIGHVGLLGPADSGGSRLIYSNSSGQKVWKQNFTLDSWIARYRDRKRLKIRFYPLPFRQPLTS